MPVKTGSATPKSPKAGPVKSVVAAQRQKVVARKLAPWVRPAVELPYGPGHFTVEEIERAVKKAV